MEGQFDAMLDIREPVRFSPSDFYPWFREWWEDQSRFPGAVRIWIDDIVLDAKLVIFAGPHTQWRDYLNCQVESRYKNGYEFPFCFVRERLTADNTLRLQTACALLAALQGLSKKEAVACIFFWYVVWIDWIRALDGRRSVLRGPTWYDAGVEGRYLRIFALRCLARRPLATLDHMMWTWERVTGRHAARPFRSESADPGKLNYRTVPPTWMSLDELGDDAGGERPLVSVLVDASFASMARHLVAVQEESFRLGRTASLRIEPRSEHQQVETGESAHPYVFICRGDVWDIVFEGKRLPPVATDKAGFRCVQYFLSRPRCPFSVSDVLAAATGVRVNHDETKVMTRQEMKIEGLVEVQAIDGGWVSDEDEIADLRKQWQELLADEDDAERLSQQEKRDAIRLEREHVETRLRQLANVNGRTRRRGASRETSRLHGLLTRAYRHIGKYSPDLESHLRAFIRGGTSCWYMPDRESIEWVTEE